MVIVIAGDIHPTYSWDSTAAKYMPLQVGNTWVYYTTTQIFMGGTGYNKYKITGIVESSGKKYYQIQKTYIHISGNVTGCDIPFFNNVRIDSVTMNVYQLFSWCNSSERLLDSLMSNIYDFAWVCTTINYSRCIDTSSTSIFGSNLQSKRFNNSGRGNSTLYVKGLGIAYWGFAEAMTQCNNNLKGCVINGVMYGDTSTLVGINQISSEVPVKFSLSQNYPNPFNPTTNIKFQMPKSGLAKLFIYDALGKEIQTLVNEQLTPGTYEVDFDASSLPSGIYYYKLESGTFMETKKMVLIK